MPRVAPRPTAGSCRPGSRRPRYRDRRERCRRGSDCGRRPAPRADRRCSLAPPGSRPAGHRWGAPRCAGWRWRRVRPGSPGGAGRGTPRSDGPSPPGSRAARTRPEAGLSRQRWRFGRSSAPGPVGQSSRSGSEVLPSRRSRVRGEDFTSAPSSSATAAPGTAPTTPLDAAARAARRPLLVVTPLTRLAGAPRALLAVEPLLGVAADVPAIPALVPSLLPALLPAAVGVAVPARIDVIRSALPTLGFEILLELLPVLGAEVARAVLDLGLDLALVPLVVRVVAVDVDVGVAVDVDVDVGVMVAPAAAADHRAGHDAEGKAGEGPPGEASSIPIGRP